MGKIIVSKRRLSTGISLATSLLTTATSSSSSSLYWADMSIPACTSSPHPASLQENKIFNSKKECCEKMLPWLNGHCIGNEDEGGSNSDDSEDGTAEKKPVDIIEPVDAIHIIESDVEITAVLDCNTLSTSECESESSCERIRKELENGLWISVCDFKTNSGETTATVAPLNDESSTTSTTAAQSSSTTTTSSEDVETIAATEAVSITFAPSEAALTDSPSVRLEESSAPTSITSSPTPAAITSSPTAESNSEAPAVITSSPAAESNSEAPFSSSSSPTDSQDPSLYCAFSFQDLESACHQAPRCNLNPCPSGMFCFPYECTHTPQSLAETIVGAAMDGLLLTEEQIVSTPSPSLPPSTDSPTPIPSTQAPMAPTDFPTPSPTRRYSTSDFIVELVEWSNIGIDESFSSSPQDEPQTMSSLYNTRTFAPTYRPTSLPTNQPTNHPVSSSPTSHPTLPTMELILPSIADATISNSRPNDNFGNLEAIAVNGGNLNTDSDRFDALLAFDVSFILDPTYTITEASIHLYAMNSCNNEGKGSIYITEDVLWDENSVNWNTAPQAQGIRIASLEDRQVFKSWIAVDVTDAISSWREGYHINNSVLSLRIMSSTESLCMFASGEGSEEYQPQLIVQYSTESRLQTMSGSLYGYDSFSSDLSTSYDVVIPPSPQEGDEMTSSSSTEAPQVAAPTLVESTEEITLLATADASISNIRQSQNFGTQNAIVVDGGDFTSGMIRGSNEESEQFDALIKFDTSSIDGNKVESVSFKIQVTKGCDHGGGIYATTENQWDQESVTWDDAPIAVGEPLGNLDVMEERQWYTVELSRDDIFSFDTLTLRISSTMNSRCMFTSVERGEDTAPRLIIKMKSLVPQTMSAGFSEAAIEPLQPTQVIIPTTGNFILIVASDDATIDANSPSAGDGDGPSLHVDYNERSRVIRDTIIRFDLTQMQGGVLPRSALLTLFTEDACDNAGTFMSTEGSGEWNENEVTWATAPTYVDNGSYEGGKMVGTFGAVEGGRWYGFSVTDALTEAVLMRKQAVTFRLTSGGMQSCSYSSIQSGRPPKILVAF